MPVTCLPGDFPCRSGVAVFETFAGSPTGGRQLADVLAAVRKSLRRSRRQAETDDRRVERLAARLGCDPDIESVTNAVLSRIQLEDVGYEPVRVSVEHLLGDDRAWQAMMMGVVPPSIRSKALCGLSRSSPTAPGDAVVAAVCAQIQEAVAVESLEIPTPQTVVLDQWQARPA